MSDLTLPELIYLIAIFRLEDSAYGVTIRKQIAELTGRRCSYGTIYSALDQLFKKGYVIKNSGPPSPKRGGRSKIFYRLTPKGKKALKAARKLQRALWKGIPEFVFDKAGTP